MRIRTLTGIAAGALTVGALVVPLSAPASAAPSSLTATQQLSCAFGSFDIAYPAEIELTADGTAVTATLSDIPPTGMPAFLKVHKTAATVAATVDGEEVELTGETTYPTPITGNPPIGMPDVAGARTGVDDVAAFTVQSLEVDMAVQAYGPGTSVSSMTCLPVAPVELSQDYSCAFGSFDIAYPAEVAVVANGTGVTATLSDVPPTGMPAFLKVHGAAATVAATIDGEEVELTGTTTYPAPVTDNPAIALPDVAGSRTGTAAASEVVLGDIEVDMTVQAYGPGTSVSSMTCTPAAPAEPVVLSGSQAFDCTFGNFSMVYTVDTEVSVDGESVTATLGERFVPGMPAFLSVSTITTDLGVSLDEEAVTLQSVSTYDPALPGTSEFELADASGARTGTGDPTTLGIESLALTMVVSGSDYVVDCALPSDVEPEETATTLSATSAAPNSVDLAATVAPSGAAGTVAFFEGETSVGEAPVAEGAAAVALTGVAAGEHTYVAVFTPSDEELHLGSTSEPVTVTVDKPVAPAIAKATKSTTKASYNKKKRQATVTVTVKAGNAKAAGKVKIVIKKGKRAVLTRTVALNKAGKVTIVIKKGKLQKKGKYVVNTAFQKNAKFKASRSKAGFTVR
ncbi:Ig-like domain repeat protein [Nocardioides sp. BGMRC 2183]|nr:Ig-like domain repeat protein [Nocardioides sp. BGMRC 2183]